MTLADCKAPCREPKKKKQKEGLLLGCLKSDVWIATIDAIDTFFFFSFSFSLPVLDSGFQAEPFANWLNARAGTSIKVQRPINYMDLSIKIIGVISCLFTGYQLITKAGKILGSKYVWSAVSMVRTCFYTMVFGTRDPVNAKLILSLDYRRLFLSSVHHLYHDLWTHVEPDSQPTLHCPRSRRTSRIHCTGLPEPVWVGVSDRCCPL